MISQWIFDGEEAPGPTSKSTTARRSHGAKANVISYNSTVSACEKSLEWRQGLLVSVQEYVLEMFFWHLYSET